MGLDQLINEASRSITISIRKNGSRNEDFAVKVQRLRNHSKSWNDAIRSNENQTLIELKMLASETFVMD